MLNKSSKDMEQLFWAIFNARDENDLHRIVTTNHMLSNENNWFPYGGLGKSDRSNFATFESQQPSPIPALVEKITNSIDSLLLKECRLAGINPKSKDAPRSMQEAVAKFFEIKNGDFSEIDPDQRRQIAENIQVVATGDKESPNLMVYDNGEGQPPDFFPITFLSLRRNNKTDIHFVQGKYNMGSTGAVTFCGKYRYQLIASKLTDDLNIEKQSNDFGFTLIRRHPLSEEQETEYGSSWYEYFVLDERVPRFPIENLKLGLSRNKVFKTGSIVKLYSYQLPRGSKSDITLDLWRDLNQFLYQPALPFLVVERRFDGRGSASKHESKLVLGNKTRIVIDDREKKELTKPFNLTTKEIGRVDIEATVFKFDVEQKEFVKDKAVVFTINGQVQGFLPRSFVSQELGLPMLRDSLLVQIDCTNVKTSFRQDLFMANRYNLKESDALQLLLDRVIQVLKSDETLKQLNQDRKNRILRDNRADEETLQSILRTIPMERDLIDLLKKNGNLDLFKSSLRAAKQENSLNGAGTKPPYVSKRFPSIFKLDLREMKDGKKVKSIPLNGKGVLEFETDAEDEYLFRPHERGEFQIQVLGIKGNTTGGGGYVKPNKVEDVFDVTVAGPTNSSIKITFEPKDNLSVGDQIELNARLSSPSGDLESIFYVKIIDPQKQQDKPNKEKPMPPALPRPIRVYERAESENHQTWQHFTPHWTGEDVVRVIPGDSENVIDAIAINMDSFVVKRYVSKNRVNSESGIKFVRDKFFVSVYLHSLFLYGIFDKLNKTGETMYDVEALVPTLMKWYSPLLLYENTTETILSAIKAD